MSFPNIPSVTPNIGIYKNQAVNLILASVAFEELGLSHVINAEAEKIQYAIGTLTGQHLPVPATIEQLLEVNDSVEKTFRSVIKNQMLLQFKLQDTIEYAGFNIFLNIAIATAEYEGHIVTATDKAYYHTKGGVA